MRKTWICLALIALAAAGCGRKEMPQATADNAPPPKIVSLAHEVSGNSLKLSIRLAGGSRGVGFQIDRAEIDPACNCPAFWRRYFEELPSPKHWDKTLTQLINLKGGEMEYAFRIRAVDAFGRLGPWSETIRARAVFQSE